MKMKARGRRNLLHNHPLLRKGGRHDSSHKANRRKERVALQKKVRWPSISISMPGMLMHGHRTLLELLSKHRVVYSAIMLGT